MYGQDWNQYMYDIKQYMEAQDRRIKALEDQLQNLTANQNDKRQVVIEKIEYKFDQLKVETLSGSLHIGLSPEDLSQIDDVALGHSNQDKVQTLPPFEHQLTSELNHWFQQSGPEMIRGLANTYHRNIDDAHQSLILQDIQKQFPNRIRFYKEQALQSNNDTNETELREYIKKKIQREIQHSLTKYIKNNKGEITNDDGSS